MRVLVAVAAFHGLSAGETGRAVAAGWPPSSARVLPIGEAGAGFVSACADGWGVPLSSGDSEPRELVAVAADAAAAGLAVAPIPEDPAQPPASEATSQPLGRILTSLLDRSCRRIDLDLVAAGVADGGAGLLAALGPTSDAPLDSGMSGLAAVTRVDLSGVRDRLRGRVLRGVVPEGELAAVLGGLRGITARRAQPVADPAALLATDAALVRWAQLAGVDPLAPGSGACGGVGTAILALGGTLHTGPSIALEGLREAGPFDLVVTGGPSFDFASRGGGVVAELARAAQRWLAPCIVVAGRVVIGAREMRTMGVEAAYEVPPDAPVTAAARRVARSWTW